MGHIPDAMFWQLVEASKGENNKTKTELFKAYKEFLFKNLSGDDDNLAKVSTPEDTHKVLNELR